MAKGKCGEDSKTRRTSMLKLAGELLTGEPMESFINAHVERARGDGRRGASAYSLLTDADPERVGFCGQRLQSDAAPIRLSATAARSKSRPNFLIC